ncbi:hypothetical protein ACWDYF_27935 [Streptomyces sp. NPDC003284]
MFFAELALIVLLEIFNPLQAAFEKLALEMTFGELFAHELMQLAVRTAAQMASILALNVVIAAALDGLTRWILAGQGRHTAHGDQYRDQSLKFGAIQGAVSSLVPFALGPIGKGIGKLPFFGPKAFRNIQQIIGGALHGPSPVRAGAKAALDGGERTVLSGGGKSAAVSASGGAVTGGVKGAGRGGLGELWDDPLNRELLSGNWFGRGIGSLSVPMAVRLQNEVVGRGARQSFRNAVGDQFARAFGERLGWRQAREAGRAWADTFMAHAGRGPKTLGRELDAALSWMPASMDALRGALSRDLAGALPSPSWMKFVRAFPEAGLQAAAMNLSEGFFNLDELGKFTTTWMTTAGGAGAAFGSAVGHIGAVKLGHWLKGRLGFDLPQHKPPLAGLTPEQLNRTFRPGPAAGNSHQPGDDNDAPPRPAPAPAYHTAPAPGPSESILVPAGILPTTGTGTPPPAAPQAPLFPPAGQVRLTIPDHLTLHHTTPDAVHTAEWPAPPATRLTTESGAAHSPLATGNRAALAESLDRRQAPEELTRHDTDDADRARLLLERPAAALEAMQHLRQLATEAGITPTDQRRLLADADRAVARRDWPQAATHLTTARDYIQTLRMTHGESHDNTSDSTVAVPDIEGGGYAPIFSAAARPGEQISHNLATESSGHPGHATTANGDTAPGQGREQQQVRLQELKEKIRRSGESPQTGEQAISPVLASSATDTELSLPVRGGPFTLGPLFDARRVYNEHGHQRTELEIRIAFTGPAADAHTADALRRARTAITQRFNRHPHQLSVVLRQVTADDRPHLTINLTSTARTGDTGDTAVPGPPQLSAWPVSTESAHYADLIGRYTRLDTATFEEDILVPFLNQPYTLHIDDRDGIPAHVRVHLRVARPPYAAGSGEWAADRWAAHNWSRLDDIEQDVSRLVTDHLSRNSDVAGSVPVSVTTELIDAGHLRPGEPAIHLTDLARGEVSARDHLLEDLLTDLDHYRDDQTGDARTLVESDVHTDTETVVGADYIAFLNQKGKSSAVHPLDHMQRQPPSAAVVFTMLQSLSDNETDSLFGSPPPSPDRSPQTWRSSLTSMSDSFNRETMDENSSDDEWLASALRDSSEHDSDESSDADDLMSEDDDWLTQALREPSVEADSIEGHSGEWQADLTPVPEIPAINVDETIYPASPAAHLKLGALAQQEWHSASPTPMSWERQNLFRLSGAQKENIFELLDRIRHSRPTFGGLWDHIRATMSGIEVSGEGLRAINLQYLSRLEEVPTPKTLRGMEVSAWFAEEENYGHTPAGFGYASRAPFREVYLFSEWFLKIKDKGVSTDRIQPEVIYALREGGIELEERAAPRGKRRLFLADKYPSRRFSAAMARRIVDIHHTWNEDLREPPRAVAEGTSSANSSSREARGAGPSQARQTPGAVSARGQQEDSSALIIDHVQDEPRLARESFEPTPGATLLFKIVNAILENRGEETLTTREEQEILSHMGFSLPLTPGFEIAMDVADHISGRRGTFHATVPSAPENGSIELDSDMSGLEVQIHRVAIPKSPEEKSKSILEDFLIDTLFHRGDGSQRVARLLRALDTHRIDSAVTHFQVDSAPVSPDAQKSPSVSATRPVTIRGLTGPAGSASAEDVFATLTEAAATTPVPPRHANEANPMSSPLSSQSGLAALEGDADIIVGEITSPYDAWNDYTRQHPDDAERLLHFAASQIPEHWGESHDAIKRAYGQLTHDQRGPRLNTMTKAQLLVTLLLHGHARTGIMEGGLPPRSEEAPGSEEASGSSAPQASLALDLQLMPLVAGFDETDRIAPGPIDMAIAKALAARGPSAGFEATMGAEQADQSPHERKESSEDEDIFAVLSALRPPSIWRDQLGVARTAELVALVRYGKRVTGAANITDVIGQVQQDQWFHTDGIILEEASGKDFIWLINNAYDTIRHSQMMIPSGRDLVIARLLKQTDDPMAGRSDSHGVSLIDEEEFRSAPSELETELARFNDEENRYYQMLRQRLINSQEDLEIFEDLRTRAVWNELSPEQIAVMVMVERHGRQIAESERTHLFKRLRRDELDWVDEYPIPSDEEMEEIIDRAHAYMREEMDITINVNLDHEHEGVPIIESMLSDPEARIFRNAWEVNRSGPYMNYRGSTEERLGYAASLKRGFGSTDPLFTPVGEERKNLPVYSALSFPDALKGAAPQYGSTVFRLKSTVRERVSHTPKDSMGGDFGRDGTRSLTGPNHLIPLLSRGKSETVRRVFAEATGFNFDSAEFYQPDPGDYFESQVHGDVKWDDVDLIRMVPKHDGEVSFYREYENRLKTFAEQHGFTFRVEVLTLEEIAEYEEWLPHYKMAPAQAIRFHADRIAVHLAATSVPEGRLAWHLEELFSLVSSDSLQSMEEAFREATQGGNLLEYLRQAVEAGRLSEETGHQIMRALTTSAQSAGATDGQSAALG